MQAENTKKYNLLINLRRRAAHTVGVRVVDTTPDNPIVVRSLLAIPRLLEKPFANLLHARITLDLGIRAEIRITNDTADTLVKVVDRVGDEQPLVARSIIVRLLKVELFIAAVQPSHLAHVEVRITAHGLLKRGHLAARQFGDGAPRFVGKHVHLAANDKDAVREKLVVGKVGAQKRVAELGTLRDVRPVDHGRHGEHVVGLFGAETAHGGLVPAETGFLVVRDGEVARGVKGDHRGDDAADGGELGDGHWRDVSHEVDICCSLKLTGKVSTRRPAEEGDTAAVDMGCKLWVRESGKKQRLDVLCYVSELSY